MKNKKIIIYIILTLIIIIVTNFLSIKITTVNSLIKGDTDYQELGLEINDYDIDYYTVYLEDVLGEYKVYKINNYYEGDSIDRIEQQLENSELWSRNKFYEYIMMRFYDVEDKEIIEIDRSNLYYYNNKDIYAILDVKNAKLYYYNYCILGTSNDNNKILEIKIDNYIAKEVYSVRSGFQGDGTDYFTYKFTEEKGKEINQLLNQNQYWSKEKLTENIIDCFEYNEEVKFIKNGYYYYKKVCRTSDDKYDFTDKQATGYEVGVYDIDKNILYYYWTSI